MAWQQKSKPKQWLIKEVTIGIVYGQDTIISTATVRGCHVWVKLEVCGASIYAVAHLAGFVVSLLVLFVLFVLFVR